jgi:hypothetical protein
MIMDEEEKVDGQEPAPEADEAEETAPETPAEEE